MKKPAIIAGFLVCAFLAAPLMQARTSALELPSSFNLGDLSITAINKEDNQQQDSTEGQVLSQSTEQPEESKPQDQDQEENTDEPVIVTVEKGDSLSKIASAHNTTYRRLFDANESIADPNIINPGDEIRIPAEDEELISRPLPEPKPVQAKPAKQNASTTSRRSSAPKQTVAASNAPAVASGSVWDQLARCESGGNWSINTGNGYYGGLQFSAATWRGVGGSGLPHQHSREEQIHRAEILLARSGWGQWPACTKKLGLR